MAKATVFPQLAAHIAGTWYRVGEDGVTSIRTGPGSPPGNALVLIVFDDDTEKRFMVHPASLVIEVGEPKEIEIEQETEKPKLYRV